MPSLIILGSADAIPDDTHANTHLAIVEDGRVVLIDAPGTEIVRLKKAGLSIGQVSDLILTHFHPDHVGGVPLLLMNMWLMQRERPLSVYGLHHCLERVEGVMGLYQWEDWPGFFQVAFHRLPERERFPMMRGTKLRFFSSPVRHVVPTIGLRIEVGDGGPVVAYSSDSEPCPAMVELAAGADILIHEASGEALGHSSPAQAGEIASSAGVDHLVLIHYPVDSDEKKMLAAARRQFKGEISFARDLDVIPL